jgi:hypothetical protein
MIVYHHNNTSSSTSHQQHDGMWWRWCSGGKPNHNHKHRKHHHRQRYRTIWWLCYCGVWCYFGVGGEYAGWDSMHPNSQDSSYLYHSSSHSPTNIHSSPPAIAVQTATTATRRLSWVTTTTTTMAFTISTTTTTRLHHPPRSPPQQESVSSSVSSSVLLLSQPKRLFLRHRHLTIMKISPTAPPTTTTATATNSTIRSSTKASDPIIPSSCHICQETFASRNALFRHVRMQHASSSSSNSSSSFTTTDSLMGTTKCTLAIWMGYPSTSWTSPTMVGQMVQQAVRTYTFHPNHNRTTSPAGSPDHHPEEEDDHHHHYHTSILSSTQVSVAKSRPTCWNQESNCASAEDILVLKVAFRTPHLHPKDRSDPEPPSTSLLLWSQLSSLTRHIHQYIAATSHTRKDIHSRHTTLLDNVIEHPPSTNMVVQLHGIRILDVTTTNGRTHDNNATWNNTKNNNNNYQSFHAEQSCTQHIYHALIPIHYLPMSAQVELRHWYTTSYFPSNSSSNWNDAACHHSPASNSSTTTTTATTTNRPHQPKIPTIIAQLKAIFRSMESPELRRPTTNTTTTNPKQDFTQENDTVQDETAVSVATSGTNRPSSSSSSSQSRHASGGGAKGRFGALAYRIPQYWHNYGNPLLRLSPNNYEPVHRVVDRARIIDFVSTSSLNLDSNDTNGNDDKKDIDHIYIVCCIIGDEFLQQQVRRMVATAIAMVHELLPTNFIDYSTHPNHIIETPLYPSDLVYRAHSRFHWHEQYNQGQRIFDYNSCRRKNTKDHKGEDQNLYICATEDPTNWMQRTILSNHAATARSSILTSTTASSHQHMPKPFMDGHDNDYDDDVVDDDDPWMSELRNVICPRIQQQMQMQMWLSDPMRIRNAQHQQVQLSHPPPEYVRVLTLLRIMVTNQKWPSTSVARSNVIETATFSPASLSLPANNTAKSSGSFTVVNTKLIHDNSSIFLPKANELFPELSKAVFELEEYIIHNNIDLPRATLQDNPDYNIIDTVYPYRCDSHRRLPSTHCAINCNAQFKPHVDSGRGMGQSVSMIVGLGDYHDGEITIEQTPYPIRYGPIEFDGWKLRHWTQPFIGTDRFTLVWFTPATMASNPTIDN